MSNVTDHRIVSHEEWIAERKALLAKEKEFNRLRDELSEQRRDLPWERVTKTYLFEGPGGARGSGAALRRADAARRLPRDVRSRDGDRPYPLDRGRGVHVCSFWMDNFEASSLT